MEKRKGRRWRVVLLFGAVLFVFVVKLANYVLPQAIRLPNLAHSFSDGYHDIVTWYENQPLFHSCGPGQRMAIVPGAYVCTQGPDNSPWTHVFDTYPLSGDRREAIYADLAKGSVGAANDLLHYQFDIQRYKPAVVASSYLWHADPYYAAYWRFYYYSLQPTLSLLVAYQQTGDARYANALLNLDNNFFRGESASPYAWRDPHATALRAMVLVYEWWALRRMHVLSLAESERFLRELAKTGDFLNDPIHYQPQLKAGTDENAALFLLGVDFRGLPGAGNWLNTARTRLVNGLGLFFDPHGVAAPGPVYYDLYTLERYWQTYEFSRTTNVPIASGFQSRLHAITNYAPYILQPNDAGPLPGASLEEAIRRHRSLRALARADPTVRYVLSQGRHGTPPSNTSIALPNLRQTIMRSGWQSAASFRDAAYVTFDVGGSGPTPGGIGALGFTLYDHGSAVLPTQNTVVTDAAGQQGASASSGPLVRRDGITYQSGISLLSDGTRHLRTLVMLDQNHYLVTDRLASAHVHTYRQIFQLGQGSRCEQTGLTARGVATFQRQSVTIQQLAPSAISLSHSIGQGCGALAYVERSRNAAYTTLISVGPPDREFAASVDRAGNQFVVRAHGRVLDIVLGGSPGKQEPSYATHPKAPGGASKPIPGIGPWTNWTASGAGSAPIVTAPDDFGHPVLRLVAPPGARESAADQAVRADLSTSNLQVRLKLSNAGRIRSLILAFSNHNWASSTRIDLRDADTALSSAGWVTSSLGRDSTLSGLAGHWQTNGAAFDWGAIDGVRVSMTTRAGTGPSPAVELDSIRATPQQRTGAVVFVFDQGYQSILPVAMELHDLKMPANVGVIATSAESSTPGYLTIAQLRMLQSQWGWNMVNDTPHGVIPAGGAYGDKLRSAEQILLDGALFLERTRLNTSPNWLIYPYAAANDVLRTVVGRFYKFVASAGRSPEAYPYGAPLRVKALALHDLRARGHSTHTPATSPANVIAAARDASRYHTTLIVMLQRITSNPADRGGYPIAAVSSILHSIKKSGIPVLTLHQLDAMDGVPENNRIVVRSPTLPLTIVAIKADTLRPREGGLWSWPVVSLLTLLAIGLLAARVNARRAHSR